MQRYPWHAWLLLIHPARVEEHLRGLVEAGVIEEAPTLWQVELGVLRMWHRVLFRPETIGTCAEQPVRSTLRARLLHKRPLRFPFLLKERAIAPLDHSGLTQPAWRMKRHLLAAHHDHNQAAYDLEILSAHPEHLQELLADARAIRDGSHPRAEWLKDLCVYEGYHATLTAAIERTLQGELPLDEAELDDPDISFRAWVRWCCAQPAAPAASIVSLLRTPLRAAG